MLTWTLIQGIVAGFLPMLLITQIPQYRLNRRKAALEQELQSLRAQLNALDEAETE